MLIIWPFELSDFSSLFDRDLC